MGAPRTSPALDASVEINADDFKADDEPTAVMPDRISVPALGAAPFPEADPLPGNEEIGPGAVVAGRYRIERVVGHGGMGAVWLAHDLTLAIDVAVKLIRRDRTTMEARVRLLKEARAAARIGHPSIVRIFDFGETVGGDPFIVMELLQGEPLGSVLRRTQRLDPMTAVGTLLPVASALVAAHGKGIVHRDLKPDNIVLVPSDAGAFVPKLLDFGIARLMDGEGERRFTIAGEVLGSPDYMSPEQARGEVDVGAATDIWAFSVMLYETLTGRRPFQGPNYNALIIAIITAEPAPAPEISGPEPGLWAILQRGLAKDVSQRFPSMRDMGVALAEWALSRGLREDGTGTSLKSTWIAGARQQQLSLHLGDSIPSPAPQRPPREPPPPAVETLTRPPFVPDRRPWIVLLVLLAVVLIGVLAYVLEGSPAGAVAPAPSALSMKGSVTPAHT